MAPLLIHDWKRAGVGLFHHFHRCWTCELTNALNAGGLPQGCYALLQARRPLFETETDWTPFGPVERGTGRTLFGGRDPRDKPPHADELMLTAQIYDHAARLRSFEIAAEARDRIAARQPESLVRSGASIA